MSRYTKALIALLTALGTWGYTAYSDGSVTAVEAWGLCGVLVAALSVYANPNSPPAGEPSDPAISETDPPKRRARGQAGLTLVEVCCAVVAVVLVLWACGVVPK